MLLKIITEQLQKIPHCARYITRVWYTLSILNILNTMEKRGQIIVTKIRIASATNGWWYTSNWRVCLHVSNWNSILNILNTMEKRGQIIVTKIRIASATNGWWYTSNWRVCLHVSNWKWRTPVQCYNYVYPCISHLYINVQNQNEKQLVMECSG